MSYLSKALEKEKVWAELYLKGSSAAEIARKEGCSDWKIHNVLRRLRIKKRSISESVRMTHKKYGRGFDSKDDRRKYYNQYKRDLKHRNPSYAARQRLATKAYIEKRLKSHKYRSERNRKALLYYRNNKLKISPRASKTYFSRRAYYIEKRKEWYRKNKQHHSKKGRLWARLNRDKKAAAYKKYMGLRLSAMDSRRNHDPSPWYFLAFELNKVYPSYSFEVEHIIPLHCGGAHTLLNCTLLPRALNRAKWNKLPSDLSEIILKEFRKWVPEELSGVYKKDIPINV